LAPLHRGRQALADLRHDGGAERQPGFIQTGFDRLGDQREDQLALRQRSRRECRDRGGKCRQRPGRGIGRALHRADLAFRHGDDEGRNDVGLGRKIPIDGTGRDTGSLGDRPDLHGVDAGLGRQRSRRRNDGVMTRGEAADDILGPAIGHATHCLPVQARQEVSQHSA